MITTTILLWLLLKYGDDETRPNVTVASSYAVGATWRIRD